MEWEDKMSASEAMATSLRVITAPSTSQDASKSRRLAHLSALVKMWQKREAESDNDGLRLHEIMLWYDRFSLFYPVNSLFHRPYYLVQVPLNIRTEHSNSGISPCMDFFYMV